MHAASMRGKYIVHGCHIHVVIMNRCIRTLFCIACPDEEIHTWTTVLRRSKPRRYSSGVEFKNDFASVTMFLEASPVNQQSFVIRAMSVAIELSRCGCFMKLGPLLHDKFTPMSSRSTILAVEHALQRVWFKKTEIDTCAQTQCHNASTGEDDRDACVGDALLKIA